MSSVKVAREHSELLVERRQSVEQVFTNKSDQLIRRPRSRLQKLFRGDTISHSEFGDLLRQITTELGAEGTVVEHLIDTHSKVILNKVGDGARIRTHDAARELRILGRQVATDIHRLDKHLVQVKKVPRISATAANVIEEAERITAAAATQVPATPSTMIKTQERQKDPDRKVDPVKKDLIDAVR